MRKLFLVLAGSGLLLASTAAAQTTPAAQASPTSAAATPERLALARELVKLLKMEEAALAGVMISLDQQLQANPEMAAQREVLVGWARDVFGSEEARTAFATLYAEHFSESDLRDLTAFYRSPVGQRLAANQGLLATKGAEVGRRLAEARQGDLLQRLMTAEPKSAKP